jgi:hypothetical protein
VRNVPDRGDRAGRVGHLIAQLLQVVASNLLQRAVRDVVSFTPREQIRTRTAPTTLRTRITDERQHTGDVRAQMLKVRWYLQTGACSSETAQ